MLKVFVSGDIPLSSILVSNNFASDIFPLLPEVKIIVLKVIVSIATPNFNISTNTSAASLSHPTFPYKSIRVLYVDVSLGFQTEISSSAAFITFGLKTLPPILRSSFNKKCFKLIGAELVTFTESVIESK